MSDPNAAIRAWLPYYCSLGVELFAAYGIVKPGAKGEAICSCKLGARCSRPGKHPATAHITDATSDIDALVKRFTTEQPLNLAMLCGRRANKIAIDFDSDDVDELMEQFHNSGRELPHTDTVISGNGVKLVYIYPPEMHGRDDRRIPSSASVVWKHVDIRADSNGYIVLPPSLHYGGSFYTWRDPNPLQSPSPSPNWILGLNVVVAPDSGPPVDIADILAWEIKPPSTESATKRHDLRLAKLEAEMLAASHGNREQTLGRLAKRAGFDIYEKRLRAEEAITALGDAALSTGLDPLEVHDKLTRAMRDGFTTAKAKAEQNAATAHKFAANRAADAESR